MPLQIAGELLLPMDQIDRAHVRTPAVQQPASRGLLIFSSQSRVLEQWNCNTYGVHREGACAAPPSPVRVTDSRAAVTNCIRMCARTGHRHSEAAAAAPRRSRYRLQASWPSASTFSGRQAGSKHYGRSATTAANCIPLSTHARGRRPAGSFGLSHVHGAGANLRPCLVSKSEKFSVL